MAGSAAEPGGGRLGTQRQFQPTIPKDQRRLQRAGGKGRLRRRPAVADADVASLAVARGDDGPLLGPCLRALLPCADVPATSLDSPLPIAIRARKLSLHAEPLGRGAGLEVPRRTPRTPWPNGRRAPRLAAAARAVARGLHRMGHPLLQEPYGMRWHLQRHLSVRLAPPSCLPRITLTLRPRGGWLGLAPIPSHAPAGTQPQHLPTPHLPRPSTPSLSSLAPPAGAPLPRRSLASNSLSGSLPTQLGALTALTYM